MKRIFISFMMLILFISCQNEAAPSVTERIVYVDRTSDAGNSGQTPTTVPSDNGGNSLKITSLQAIIDDPATGNTIDCSLYNISDYNATVSKSLTIKNANMQGDTLKVTSSGVVLENVSKAAVNTNSSLKISGSSLSSLSIGNVTNGRGELLYSLNTGRGDDQAIVVELEGATVVRDADLDIAGASIVTDATADIENIEVKKTGAIKGNAANIRIAGSKIKLEVTDLSADKVTFVGNNTTLDVMNKESSIKNVETDEDVICQLEMEEGSYTNMNNPTVKGENGKVTRVDKTKDAVLEKLSIDQMPEKIAYSADETLDLTGLQIVETYRTSGIVEFTKDWENGHLVETYTRLEANPLTNTAYSFKMKTQNVSAIGYEFKEADKGENTIVITKTEDETVISTEALKVVVLKDDEYAISYGGIDPQDIIDYNMPRFYKKTDTITLATNLTKTGFVFAGWYEDNNKGPITGWAANTKEGSVSLYARWINMLYVDPDLTDDVGYGSYDKPFKTIERAIAAITSTGSYTIVLKNNIDSYGKIYFKNNFPINITIQPEEGSAYIKGYEYLMFEDNFEQTKNIDLTMKNITFDGEIDAANSKSLTLENVNIGNGIRCGQASFTNVTTLGDVFCSNAVFTDVTIDGDFIGTDISFNNVLVTKGAYFEQGSLTQVKINGNVTCDSAVFSNAELSQVTCNGDSTFKNVTLTSEDRSLFANGDINLGGNLSFAGKINLAAGKKIILTDRIATDNPIVLAITSAEQKDQIIDGRSEYVNANWNKFVIDGTAWYLKNGQLRRYWYVDGESGDDSNIGSEDHP
ncbi:MAG: InlB B-repeat-containing protein, partial [Spirochaetales bacterium]|nr:InlB B-repeat-containing protein [Spirochaetales bacterium]